MEKLIELLNEFLEEKYPKKNLVKAIEDDYFVNNWNDGDGFLCETIMSKKFGWIKRLVENDKIDLWSNRFTEKEEHYFGEQPDFTFQSVKYTHLLMLLSISSSPIEDLLLYLK